MNAVKEGSRRVDGPVYPRIGLIETLEATKASEHWNTPLEGENRGRGVAVGFWFNIGLKWQHQWSVEPGQRSASPVPVNNNWTKDTGQSVRTWRKDFGVATIDEGIINGCHG